MLSDEQRGRIIAGLAGVSTLPLKSLASGYASCWVPEPPDIAFEVTSQGVRQNGFLDLMWDYFDGVIWTEKRGHISRATIQLTIEMMDTRALELEAFNVYNNLWALEAGLHREDSSDYMLFRGADPPKFMPPYTEDPAFPYRVVIEYFVDYFDTFTALIPPIKEVGFGINDQITLTATWQEEFYVLDVIFE